MLRYRSPPPPPGLHIWRRHSLIVIAEFLNHHRAVSCDNTKRTCAKNYIITYYKLNMRLPEPILVPPPVSEVVEHFARTRCRLVFIEVSVINNLALLSKSIMAIVYSSETSFTNSLHAYKIHQFCSYLNVFKHV